MKYLCAILLVCVAVASAQVPFRCKSPDTWEAKYFESSLGSELMRAGRIYYDAPGQRVVVIEEEFEEGRELYAYTDYFFHKERYYLKYNQMTKSCYRYNLTTPFQPVEVPPTARFIDTVVIGTNAVEELGLAVNIWGDDSSINGRTIYEFVADDGDGDEDCLPVSVVQFGSRTGTPYRRQSFFDIVIGVNPSHFIPPENCPRS